MFGSETFALCMDDSAQVNSHHMHLHDIEIHNSLNASDDHHMDVHFDLRDEDKDSRHLLLINASHVIQAAEGLADYSGLSTHERDLIKTSLRLLERRSREESKRWASETN